MFSLNGKTALITGSGRGIGLAIAEAMAHQGANIFLSDINSSVVERAAGELAGKYPNVAVRGLTFDVTDKAQIESAIQTIKDAGNGLQILVNNAGINLREPVAPCGRRCSTRTSPACSGYLGRRSPCSRKRAAR